MKVKRGRDLTTMYKRILGGLTDLLGDEEQPVRLADGREVLASTVLGGRGEKVALQRKVRASKEELEEYRQKAGSSVREQIMALMLDHGLDSFTAGEEADRVMSDMDQESPGQKRTFYLKDGASFTLQRKARRKTAAWVDWEDAEGVEVVTREGTEIFNSLEEAQQKYPGLDPKRNTADFTWAMQGSEGRMRFEDWETDRILSMGAKGDEEEEPSKQDKDIEKKITDFLKENPNPEDEAIHGLAKILNINKHEFEEIIYRMLGERLGKTAANASVQSILKKLQQKGSLSFPELEKLTSSSAEMNDLIDQGVQQGLWVYDQAEMEIRLPSGSSNIGDIGDLFDENTAQDEAIPRSLDPYGEEEEKTDWGWDEFLKDKDEEVESAKGPTSPSGGSNYQLLVSKRAQGQSYDDAAVDQVLEIADQSGDLGGAIEQVATDRGYDPEQFKAFVFQHFNARINDTLKEQQGGDILDQQLGPEEKESDMGIGQPIVGPVPSAQRGFHSALTPVVAGEFDPNAPARTLVWPPGQPYGLFEQADVVWLVKTKSPNVDTKEWEFWNVMDILSGQVWPDPDEELRFAIEQMVGEDEANWNLGEREAGRVVRARKTAGNLDGMSAREILESYDLTIMSDIESDEDHEDDDYPPTHPIYYVGWGSDMAAGIYSGQLSPIFQSEQEALDWVASDEGKATIEREMGGLEASLKKTHGGDDPEVSALGKQIRDAVDELMSYQKYDSADRLMQALVMFQRRNDVEMLRKTLEVAKTILEPTSTGRALQDDEAGPLISDLFFDGGALEAGAKGKTAAYEPKIGEEIMFRGMSSGQQRLGTIVEIKDNGYVEVETRMGSRFPVRIEDIIAPTHERLSRKLAEQGLPTMVRETSTGKKFRLHVYDNGDVLSEQKPGDNPPWRLGSVDEVQQMIESGEFTAIEETSAAQNFQPGDVVEYQITLPSFQGEQIDISLPSTGIATIDALMQFGKYWATDQDNNYRVLDGSWLRRMGMKKSAQEYKGGDVVVVMNQDTGQEQEVTIAFVDGNNLELAESSDPDDPFGMPAVIHPEDVIRKAGETPDWDDEEGIGRV
jgi:hypothetical protein